MDEPGNTGNAVEEERRRFYGRIDPLHMAPLWEAFAELVSPEPRTPCRPHLWAYREVRPHLMEAGGLISAQEAERRVLVLENPGLRGHHSITHSLYAGLQLVLPGETAPRHRHSQTALRLIVEGSGAYTSIDGERVRMEPGDFIITGAWSWHDHGNDTAEPVVWLDGLDIPLVRFLDASFLERHPEEKFRGGRPAGDNRARHGKNMRPVDAAPAGAGAGPALFRYPYAESREALETMRRLDEWDSHHGLKMEFINPADGGPVMPTISAFIQLLPAGFETQPYRSTDGTVYTPVEGAGVTEIAGRDFAWEAGDVFVVPSWAPHRHRAGTDSVLFSFSDRGVQRKLGLWREKRETAP